MSRKVKRHGKRAARLIRHYAGRTGGAMSQAMETIKSHPVTAGVAVGLTAGPLGAAAGAFAGTHKERAVLCRVAGQAFKAAGSAVQFVAAPVAEPVVKGVARIFTLK